jgi:hypothetical protein
VIVETIDHPVDRCQRVVRSCKVVFPGEGALLWPRVLQCSVPCLVFECIWLPRDRLLFHAGQNVDADLIPDVEDVDHYPVLAN